MASMASILQVATKYDKVFFWPAPCLLPTGICILQELERSNLVVGEMRRALVTTCIEKATTGHVIPYEMRRALVELAPGLQILSHGLRDQCLPFECQSIL